MERQSPNMASSQLLEYIALLENELERRQMAMDITKSAHVSEKASLKAQLEDAHKRLREACEELQARKDVDGQTRSIVYDMKNDFFETGFLLEEELEREKVLEDKLHKLEVELENKDNLLDHRWRRHEKARKQLEKENLILKKKATLGWMLGCLSEAYMLSQPKGEATPLLRMVRSVQRELERENVVPNGTNDPLHVKLEHVEQEIRHLIQSAKATSPARSETNNSQEQSKHRKEEDGPCFVLTIRKAAKGSKKAGGEKEDQGVEQREEVEEKLQSTQDEIKQILGRLEASMEQLIQSKKQGTVEASSERPAAPAAATEQQGGGGGGGEEQQGVVQMQERSIDDLILSKARIPSRKPRIIKAKKQPAAPLSNNSKPFLPPGQARH